MKTHQNALEYQRTSTYMIRTFRNFSELLRTHNKASEHFRRLVTLPKRQSTPRLIGNFSELPRINKDDSECLRISQNFIERLRTIRNILEPLKTSYSISERLKICSNISEQLIVNKNDSENPWTKKTSEFSQAF